MGHGICGPPAQLQIFPALGRRVSQPPNPPRSARELTHVYESDTLIVWLNDYK